MPSSLFIEAIDAIELIPGSSPMFGLNTLGGALAISTKDGKAHPGGEIKITGGSWGRKTAQVEQGGTIGQNLDYYVTGNVANNWMIGSNLTYRDGVYAHGDQNNEDVNGKIPGFVLIDFDTAYDVTKHLRVFATVTNVLNKRYASYGVLGQNFSNGPNHTFDGQAPVNELFVGPGAPRGRVDWHAIRVE